MSTTYAPVRRSLRKIAFAIPLAHFFLGLVVGVVLIALYGSALSVDKIDEDTKLTFHLGLASGVVLIISIFPAIIFANLNYKFIDNPDEALWFGVIQILFFNPIAGILLLCSGGINRSSNSGVRKKETKNESK